MQVFCDSAVGPSINYICGNGGESQNFRRWPTKVDVSESATPKIKTDDGNYSTRIIRSTRNQGMKHS